MKYYIILILIFSCSLFGDDISIDNNTSKIIEISDINVAESEIIDENVVGSLLTDDLFIGMLPYNIPFVNLKVNEENLNNCSVLLKDYIIKKGYPNPLVNCVFDNEEKTLNIDIKEGKAVKINSVFFDNNYDDIKLCENKKICLKSGDIFNEELQNNFKSNVSSILEREGYIFNSIELTPVYHNDYLVDLKIKIDKKNKIFIGKVTLEIEGDVSPDIVENLMFFKQGDVFDYTKIRDSINNIKSKNVFSFITVTPIFHEMANDILPVKVSVSVKEKTKKISASIGYDSFEGLRASASWTNYMYHGNMKKLGAKIDVSKYIQNIETNFFFPFLLPDYKINLYNDFGYQREDTLQFKNQYIYDDIYLNRAFQNFEINLGLRGIMNSPLDNIDSSVYQDIIISIYQNIKFAEIDDIFFPKKGYKIETEVESSIFVSSFDFLELKLGVYGYYPLWKEKNLYVSGKMFLDNIKSDSNIIDIKRPLSGGYNSNRGFDFQSIKEVVNTNSIVKVDSSLEIKQEVYNNVYWFMFDDYTLMNNQTYNSVGVGAYYYSPLGVFSVGVSHNNKNDLNAFFSIGASF